MLDRNAIIVLCVAVLTVFIGGAVVWLFISLKRLRGELSESSVSSLAALRKDNDRTRELTLKLGASSPSSARDSRTPRRGSPRRRRICRTSPTASMRSSRRILTPRCTAGR